MIKEKRHIKFMRFFLPILFIFYFGGITLFTHTHVVNGVIIVHSHPYKAEHTHTAQQAETIFFLSSLYTYGDIPQPLTPVLWLTLIGILVAPAVSNKPLCSTYGVISLRAPPVLD